MKGTKINLFGCQIKKIKDAWKNQKAASIRLSYEQISGTGKYKLLLPQKRD